MKMEVIVRATEGKRILYEARYDGEVDISEFQATANGLDSVCHKNAISGGMTKTGFL
jgi:hypothetical protein